MTLDRVVAVVGLGYIGLPTAAVFATHGHDVVGVDVDCGVVAAVNRREVPFVEPDLEIAVTGAVGLHRLRATTEMPAAQAYLVAVPTPGHGPDGADLSSLLAAADAVAAVLQGGELVVLESTIPPGTTRMIAERIAADRADLSVGGVREVPGARPVEVAHCPERVLPGRIMIEIVTNDRIVGGLTPRAGERAAELYRSICQGQILQTSAETAELCKLVENAYRDVNIAFANELSAVCDRLGVDVWELVELANHHPRVDILKPGPGVGGHCIAVDPWFIVSAAPEEARLIRTAREVNDGKPERVVQEVLTAVATERAAVVACLGLAFKANVDDLRESPAVDITRRLARRVPSEVRILAVEPHIEVLPDSLAEAGVELTAVEQALAKADVVVLLVDHDQFADVTVEQLRGKSVVDTRGQWRALGR